MRAKFSPNRAWSMMVFIIFMHVRTTTTIVVAAANDETVDDGVADDDECNCRFYWLYG